MKKVISPISGQSKYLLIENSEIVSEVAVSKDLKEVGMDEVDSVLSTSNTLSSELFLLERNINIILTKVKASLKLELE